METKYYKEEKEGPVIDTWGPVMHFMSSEISVTNRETCISHKSYIFVYKHKHKQADPTKGLGLAETQGFKEPP